MVRLNDLWYDHTHCCQQENCSIWLFNSLESGDVSVSYVIIGLCNGLAPKPMQTSHELSHENRLIITIDIIIVIEKLSFKKAYKNIVCKISAILFQHVCVNSLLSSDTMVKQWSVSSLV